jgi:hypothetical protein
MCVGGGQRREGGVVFGMFWESRKSKTFVSLSSLALQALSRSLALIVGGEEASFCVSLCLSNPQQHTKHRCVCVRVGVGGEGGVFLSFRARKHTHVIIENGKKDRLIE